MDVFKGALDGLVMAEAEFENVQAMHAYAAPDFAGREVTEDLRFTGGELVTRGLPGPAAAPTAEPPA